MSGINTHTWLQRKRYGGSLIIVVLALAVQLMSPLAANAAVKGPTGGGGSLGGAASLSLDDQILSYKMVYALSKCMTTTSFIADADVTSGSWFSSGQNEDTGSLAAESYSGGTDGVVNCNKTLKNAFTMWGIGDHTTFLKDAGWTPKTSTVGPPCPNPNYCANPGGGQKKSGLQAPKNNVDTLFQAAVGSAFGNYQFPYESYYSYEDAFTTYTGICGGKYLSKGPLTGDQKTSGDVLLQVPDTSTNKVVTQVFSSSTKSVHFGAALGLVGSFGSAVNPSGYQYNGKQVSCSAIASYLAKPANAQSFLSALPPSLASSVNPAEYSTNSQNSSDTGTTCGVTGIGWIVCPVMTFLANLNDQAFGVLNNFLEVKSNLTTGSGLVTSWSAFRNLANIMFVIAFLVVIYSQITGMGVSNYGIKKLLPRIIAVAILVNISLILCQIAVDLSNIIGASIYDMFKGIPTTMGQNATPNSWDKVMAVILEAAAGVALLIAIILAPMALLAVAVALLLLIARQAIIVILIVIAPLAFVAYLLPNTASYFKKWWKVFSSMLMLYPIVGAIFGGSTLASKIIAGTQSSSTGADKWIMPLMALGVMALPLFLVPTTLKNAFSSLGSIGGKLAAIQTGANKRSKTAIKESRLGEMKAAHDRNKFLNKMRARSGNGRMTRIGQKKVLQKIGVGKALEKADIAKAGVKLDSSKIGRKYGLDRGAANAAAQVAEAYDKDVKSDRTRLLIENEHHDILEAAKEGKIGIRDSEGKLTGQTRKLSHTELDAAIQYTMEFGNALERQELLTHAGDPNWERDHRHSAEQGVRKKGDTGIFGSGTLGAFGENSEAIAGKSAAEVQDFLKNGIIDRARNGSLSVQEALRDGHTAKYIRDALVNPPTQAIPANASPQEAARINATNAANARKATEARTNFRAAIEEVKNNNPQAWANIGQDVKAMVEGTDTATYGPDPNDPTKQVKTFSTSGDQFNNEGKKII